jgi:hypothetical protein
LPIARLLLVSALLAAPHAAADPYFRHEAARPPASEGWNGGNPGVGTSAGPLDDAGTAAWFVRDASTAGGSTLTYVQTPSSAQISAAGTAGWVLAVRLRVVDPGPAADPVDFSVFAEYADGTRRYNLRFGAGAGGVDPVVAVGTLGTHTVADPAGGYHRYELAFDPAAGSATLYVDGIPTSITGYAGEDAGPAGTRVTWGAGQSNTTGEANYALVEWGTPRDIDQDDVPDHRDNCPGVQNNPNLDGGGVGNGSGPDRIGDACQCGDLGFDTRVDAGDELPIRQQLADPDGSPLGADEAALCNVWGIDEGCDLVDAVVIARRAQLASPAIQPICAAALGYGLTCGDGTCTALRETCQFAGPGACQADCGHCPSGAACAVHADCQTGFCEGGACKSDPAAAAGTCGDGVCDEHEGCGSSPPGCQPDCGACPLNLAPGEVAEGDRCSKDADCEAPEETTLVANCATDYTCGGELDGERCHWTDSDCGDEDCLKVDGKGTCTTEQDNCFFDSSDCRSPARCSGTVCVDSLTTDGGPCGQHADCESGLCNFGFCRSGTQDNGTLCTTDSACTSGQCLAGFCVSIGCGDETCSAPAETCYSTGALSCQDDCGGCPNGTPCIHNADCASGICNFGFCIGACQGANVPCTTGAACCSTFCAGICLAACRDGTCSSPNELCGAGDSDPVCESDCGRCPNGNPCFSNNTCASGICNFGFCIGACQGVGIPCTTDAACCSGSCEAGLCTPFCGDGTCSPPLELCGASNSGLNCRSDCGGCPNGTPCTSNGTCASGICNFGFCIGACQGFGVPCTTDAACCSGNCSGICGL